MHNHNAIELLKTLNEDELKRLVDFLNSPFFNKKEVVCRLFSIIEKKAPDYKGTSLKKENLHKKLFPGKKYNEQMLRNRMSELTSLIKQFITITGFQKDEMLQKKCYTKQLRKKEKFELAEKQISETFELIEKRNNFDEVYFKDKLDMLYESVKIHSAKDKVPMKLKLSYKRTEYILNYFFLNLLGVNTDIILNEIEGKTKPDFDFAKHFFDTFDFEKYLSVLKEKKYEHYPLIAIHYYGNLSILKPENEDYYRKIKELIFNHYEKFNLMQVYNFWSLLSNSIFVNYINKGSAFLKEGHEVNKFFVEKELYPKDRPFSPQAYKNTIINALFAKEIEWADDFAEKYKSKLSSESRDNRYNYCKALILSNKKNYNESIEYLGKVFKDDWNSKLNVRLLYIKNYYELGCSEQVFSHIDAFMHYRVNNPDNIPGYLEDKVKDTLFYLNKIANAKFNGKKFDYADYKKAKELNTLLYKEWLLEKMEELLSYLK